MRSQILTALALATGLALPVLAQDGDAPTRATAPETLTPDTLAAANASSPAQREALARQYLRGDSGEMAQPTAEIAAAQTPQALAALPALPEPDEVSSATTDIVMHGGGAGEGSSPYNFQLEGETRY
jgi:hypothetical protein